MTISPELATICEQLEIEIVDTTVSRGPGQTCATKTLERILAEHGEFHLKMVLMTIMETENNKLELVAPTLWAVSDVILAHPTWAESGSRWFEAVDAIDLAMLRETAKANREAAKPRQAIATMLFERLRPIFGEDQGRLL